MTKQVNGKEIELGIERKVHMRIQVLWKDKTVSWRAADAMRHQNPYIFIPYVLNKQLLKDIDFKCIRYYWKDNEKSRNIYKIFKTKTKASRQPKYKFGIQVPNNTGHAYKLDNINKDEGWKIAMDKEIDSINKHKTFIVLEEHEQLPYGYQ